MQVRAADRGGGDGDLQDDIARLLKNRVGNGIDLDVVSERSHGKILLGEGEVPDRAEPGESYGKPSNMACRLLSEKR